MLLRWGYCGGPGMGDAASPHWARFGCLYHISLLYTISLRLSSGMNNNKNFGGLTTTEVAEPRKPFKNNISCPLCFFFSEKNFRPRLLNQVPKQTCQCCLYTIYSMKKPKEKKKKKKEASGARMRVIGDEAQHCAGEAMRFLS